MNTSQSIESWPFRSDYIAGACKHTSIDHKYVVQVNTESTQWYNDEQSDLRFNE